MDLTGIGRVADRWAKGVARRVEEQVGPDLDLDADQIERFTSDAAGAVAKGAIEELLEKRASLPGAEPSCPIRHRLCSVKRRLRIMPFSGGEVA
jgi:hypothetical protein